MPSRPRPGTSDEIRRAFIEFFAERGHVHQPSSSLVPFNDPSVPLTTAGMQQMIPYMLGREVPPAIRMTSIQKCFRTGDIDEVPLVRGAGAMRVPCKTLLEASSMFASAR